MGSREVESKTYLLPGGQATAEIRRMPGANRYFALVEINGRYPERGKLAQNVGRTESLHVVDGNSIRATVNDVDYFLKVGSKKQIENGDCYSITGRGKIVVFVEDEEGGKTEIVDMHTS